MPLILKNIIFRPILCIVPRFSLSLQKIGCTRHKFTNSQIHKFINSQISKFTNSPFRLFTFLRKHHDFTFSLFHLFTFSRFRFLRKHHDFTFSPFHLFTFSQKSLVVKLTSQPKHICGGCSHHQSPVTMLSPFISPPMAITSRR